MNGRSTAITLLVLSACFLALPASAQVDCNALAHWSNTVPRINQTLVFCGEWSGGAPKDFHSRPGGLNPNTVLAFAVTQGPNAKGLYGGRWSYTGHPGVTKFSTMFPNTCSMEEVLNSILYAATNQSACPPGAPAWATCGYNKPVAADPDARYCEAADGSRFFIGMGFLGADVNTAFPLM
jgi:hypothetical protein